MSDERPVSDDARGCRACRAGLDHCHGTVIRHSARCADCTESDCGGPELVAHNFVIDCDAVGCGCRADAVRIAV